MAHLNKFADRAAYEAAKSSISYPAVSLLNDGTVIYDSEESE